MDTKKDKGQIRNSNYCLSFCIGKVEEGSVALVPHYFLRECGTCAAHCKSKKRESDTSVALPFFLPQKTKIRIIVVLLPERK